MHLETDHHLVALVLPGCGVVGSRRVGHDGEASDGVHATLRGMDPADEFATSQAVLEAIADPARSALLHQLHYKERTDANRLFDYPLRRAADTEFFIRKAIGWAIRQYSKVAPAAVAAFVDEHEHTPSGLTAGYDAGARRSSSAATWNMRASCSAGVMIWTPTGRPSAPGPNGTLIAGSPVRLAGIV